MLSGFKHTCRSLIHPSKRAQQPYFSQHVHHCCLNKRCKAGRRGGSWLEVMESSFNAWTQHTHAHTLQREWRPWLEVMEICYNAAFHQGNTHKLLCCDTCDHVYTHKHIHVQKKKDGQSNTTAWCAYPWWPLRSVQMEDHPLTGWVGWSAGLNGPVHLGILLKRFTYTNINSIIFIISYMRGISQSTSPKCWKLNWSWER